MIDYQELRVEITPCSEAACDLLAAFLADEGYESFVPDNEGLTAYIAADHYDPEVVDILIKEFPMPVTMTYRADYIKGRDWNEEWEKNYFKPIVVGDRCVIHSTFHTDIPVAEYDIVIDPKMAFGTGHHATTSLIIQYLLSIDLSGRSIIDMGTGTGILAILCDMRGAVCVDAVEIDPGACENACENVRINGADKVRVIQGDASALASLSQADLLIANINRNIILADFDSYADALKPGGEMLLSGFYEDDVPLIKARALQFSLIPVETRVYDRWCALRLGRVR